MMPLDAREASRIARSSFSSLMLRAAEMADVMSTSSMSLEMVAKLSFHSLMKGPFEGSLEITPTFFCRNC